MGLYTVLLLATLLPATGDLGMRMKPRIWAGKRSAAHYFLAPGHLKDLQQDTQQGYLRQRFIEMATGALTLGLAKRLNKVPGSQAHRCHM